MNEVDRQTDRDNVIEMMKKSGSSRMNRIDECHLMNLTDRQTCDWKCDEIQNN